MRGRRVLASLLWLGALGAGCNTNNSGISVVGDASGAGGSGGSGPGGAGAGTGGNGAGTGGAAGFGFNVTDGGTGSGDGAGNTGCGQLLATVRDFKDDHPDMEKIIDTVRGLVQRDLGPDGKPVYAPAGPTRVTAGRASFDQWYRDVPGVNMSFGISLPLVERQPGTFVFSDNAFFPLDGRGFMNQGRDHNFHFTTEIHATFRSRGGERFVFTGDDDVFIFINKKLALDLGGVHPPQMATIDFDAMRAQLGIAVGGTYSFDAFHAERHTTQSNFRMETSIDCLETIK
jgi:fibro-slime domain-containing protein